MRGQKPLSGAAKHKPGIPVTERAHGTRGCWASSRLPARRGYSITTRAIQFRCIKGKRPGGPRTVEREKAVQQTIAALGVSALWPRKGGAKSPGRRPSLSVSAPLARPVPLKRLGFRRGTAWAGAQSVSGPVQKKQGPDSLPRSQSSLSRAVVGASKKIVAIAWVVIVFVFLLVGCVLLRW
jgi:hypothetical protein